MTSKDWFFAVISLIAKFLFFWYLLDAIRNVDTYSLPLAAFVLLVLFYISVFTCPLMRKLRKNYLKK